MAGGGALTTHVLDTAAGVPAAGLEIVLERLGADGERELLVRTRTNRNGRTDEPLLAAGELTAGSYELSFAVAPYFAGLRPELPDPPFLDRVSVRFGVADPSSNYHVPLLLSPWSYAVYRGS